MKKVILLSFFLLAIHAIHAQKNVEKAASETCDCLNKAKLPDNISGEEFQKALTTCLQTPVLNYYGKICKEIKVAADNSQESYEAVGAKIGLKMADNCPLFLQLAMNAEKEKEKKLEAVVTKEETGKEGTSSGTIKSVESKDFYYITIETASGNKESYIWLRYFQGSAPFENNPAAQVGKKATIKYREIRCFSPALGDYTIKKEITEIVLQD
ncbi:MAG: hypothetical protein K0S33_3457 [Bacteroidetes bacterium]|jgi:hypothetical protein|nr:hypothetical protein [Bacteroidota bacterium]